MRTTLSPSSLSWKRRRVNETCNEPIMFEEDTSASSTTASASITTKLIDRSNKSRYSNDCYDDIFWNCKDDCEWNDTIIDTITGNEHHIHPTTGIRSSWFKNTKWIHSSSKPEDEQVQVQEQVQQSTDNIDIVDIDHTHENYVTMNDDSSIDNENRNTNDNRNLPLEIQHIHQQLVQVKRRLRPAIERYDTIIQSTKNNNNHHNNNNKYHHPNIFVQARRVCNPYEVLGEGQHNGLNNHFMNRSAIKLANIDAILDFTLTATSSTSTSTTTTTTKIFKFCDLCGAPGGFSEYILYRLLHQPHNIYQYNECRGYGMSLFGMNEHGYGIPWKLNNIQRFGEHDYHQHPYGENRIQTNNMQQRQHQHQQYKICYGFDGTGDIYNWDNVISLQETIYNDDCTSSAQYRMTEEDIETSYTAQHEPCNNNGRVHLIVVDGGFDAQRDTEYQEEISLKLIVCEAAAALSLLKRDGKLIMKLFGFQTSIIRTMMIHLSFMFEKVTVVKPISSRPASAERYVVCYGFLGHPISDWSGQRWCNDIYLGRPYQSSDHTTPSTDHVKYIDKELELLRYLDEFDRDMYTLNLKATFAILSYIERKYLQHVVSNFDTYDESDNTDDDYDDVEEDLDDPFYDAIPRANIPMYRIAWRLE
jgi:cap1 methyltransferase